MLLHSILSFCIGVGAILIGARIFLSLAEELSARWRLSPLFIAIVVLALGTNLPEFAVTIASIIQKDPGLALGNVVGSSITNLALIFGATSLLGVVKVGTKKTQRTGLLLACVVVFFMLLQFVSISAFSKALLFLGALVAGLWYEYALALNGRTHEDKAFLKRLKQKRKKPKYTGVLALLAGLIALAGLGVGGMIVVRATNELSILLGMSTTVFGLAVNSLATTLPELSLVVAAGLRRENKVVIGTLAGSNVFNLTLFPALIYLFSGFAPLPTPQLVLLCVTTGLFVSLLFLYKGKVIPLSASLLLLGVYVLFTVTNIQTAIH